MLSSSPLSTTTTTTTTTRSSTMPGSRSKAPRRKRSANDVIVLLPFLLLVGVYLYLIDPLRQRRPPETLLTAVAKVAPIVYLACYVGSAPKFHDNVLAQGARVGLVLSCLGDVCLVWSNTLFLPGMFLFALAQLGYIVGSLSWRRRGGVTYATCHGEYVRETALLCVGSVAFVYTGMDSNPLALCVLAYSGLLFAAGNLALQRHLVEGNAGSKYGLVGAGLFVFSDLLIAVCKWKFSFPLYNLVIMLSYYAAQVAIAGGAVHAARAKRRE